MALDHPIRYLTVEDVLALHAAAMQETGSTSMPLRNIGLLESALTRPQMAAYYAAADLIHQSALLLIPAQTSKPATQATGAAASTSADTASTGFRSLRRNQ